MDWLGRGGGCTDLALAALELDKILVVSDPVADELSIDVLVRSIDRSACRLGRLFWGIRTAGSMSPSIPGPTDLRGGFVMFALETGG